MYGNNTTEGTNTQDGRHIIIKLWIVDDSEDECPLPILEHSGPYGLPFLVLILGQMVLWDKWCLGQTVLGQTVQWDKQFWDNWYLGTNSTWDKQYSGTNSFGTNSTWDKQYLGQMVLGTNSFGTNSTGTTSIGTTVFGTNVIALLKNIIFDIFDQYWDIIRSTKIQLKNLKLGMIVNWPK